MKCQSPRRAVKILAFSLPIVCVYNRDVKFYGVCNHKGNEVKVNYYIKKFINSLKYKGHCVHQIVSLI